MGTINNLAIFLVLHTTKIERTQLSFCFSPIVSNSPILQAQTLWWSPGPVARKMKCTLVDAIAKI